MIKWKLPFSCSSAGLARATLGEARKGGVPPSEGKPGLPADAEILLTE